MDTVDLCFSIVGTTLPLDHAYGLYAAVSRVLGPQCHTDADVGIHPIRGVPVGPSELHLNAASCLRFRTPTARIRALLALAGKELNVDGYRLRVGVSRTHCLRPAPSLYSHLVTIKGFEEPVPFLDAVQRQLDALNVAGRPTVPLRTSGPHEGEPTRRVLRIKDKTVVGFALLVSELTAEESLTLQEKGIGGRRHMGCGIFVPARGWEEA